MIFYTAIYRLAIQAYSTAVRIAALFNPKAALFIRGRAGLIERMRLAYKNETRQSIWMHCASLGEFEQGRPVLEALRSNYPQYAIVVTFFSPSGYEVRKDYKGADHVFYLPLDTPKNATAFLEVTRPALCIFVKYEFWYYLLKSIKQQQIPAILISGIFHKEQPFFKWYGGLMRSMLGSFTHLFVQDEASLKLLQQIKINNASVSGDTRFDRVIQAAQLATPIPLAEQFCKDHEILVAGSTWKEDEQLLSATMHTLTRRWKMILVPHEVDEDHIEQIEKLLGENCMRWSAIQDLTAIPDKRILLVDKVGFLMQLYRYATAAWIGGGFGKEGVHNVLEAAVYGKPCFYGPVFHQFIEAKELVDKGGAMVMKEPKDLTCSLTELEDSYRYEQHAAAAKEYVYSKAGATAIVANYVTKHLLP
jgi:3-deoxy-D-manno-octulosonic-acid transferase